MTEEKKKVGRKLKWRAGETELIRVPKVFVQQILAYTHQLDSGQVSGEISPVLESSVWSEADSPPAKTDEIKYQRLLIEMRDNFDAITPTESAVDRLEKVKAELEEQISEVRQLKQQGRESQRLIREKDDALNAQQQKNQSLDGRLGELNQELEKLTDLVNGLKAENDKLRIFRRESGEAELLVTEILGLIHNASSNAVKMYVKSIYSLSEGKPIEQVRLCLAVMANIREKNTRYNNCCCAAAERVLAGPVGVMTLQEIMEAVEVDYNERLERSQRD